MTMKTAIARRDDKSPSIAQSINRFKAAYNAGMEGIKQAAQIYVAAIDANPRNADKFRKELPAIPAGSWATFEAVGRKWIHVNTLLPPSDPDRRKVFNRIKKMPVSIQERIFDNKECFMLHRPNGKPVMIDIQEATPEQAEQMCDKHNIRSLAEQKKYLALKAATPVSTPMPYTITEDGKVHVRRGVVLDLSEIRQITTAMEGKGRY